MPSDASDEKAPNLAHLKMLASEELAEKIAVFITDLRTGKNEDDDETWWDRFDEAIRWLTTEDLKRGWRRVVYKCLENGVKPWENERMWKKLVEDIEADVMQRFEGDVLSNVAFTRGPTSYRGLSEETNLTDTYEILARRGRKRK